MAASSPLTALSPLDGRYASKMESLSTYFSESALFQARAQVEIEYLIALGDTKAVVEVPAFSETKKKALRKVYQEFTLKDAAAIKKIEATTNHDVKAVEYFLKKKLAELKLTKIEEMVHFGLTSQDMNNTAQPLLIQAALKQEIVPALVELLKIFKAMARQYKSVPMLSRTHGQSASPTTVGKEMAVFAMRLQRQLDQLKAQQLMGKFGGATGNFHTQSLAYPNVDWLTFGERFIKKLGLEPNMVTTQIAPYDDLAEVFDNLRRVNVILLDFSKDMWQYISMGYFTQKLKKGEIGSSTMPHKVNPIDFENAEGNLGLANALFSHFSQKLPISRLQRDLTDSTVLRNVGVPFGHTLLASSSLIKGIGKLEINKTRLDKDLEEAPEVLAEPIQTVLRKAKFKNPYEELKKMTRGKKLTLPQIKKYLKTLPLSKKDFETLVKLTPKKYTGLAREIVDRFLKR